MASFKIDDPRYGRFLKPGEPAGPADSDVERRLRVLAEWLRRQDPQVLGVRLVAEDQEAGGKPMVHVAFPLGRNRVRDPARLFDPGNPAISDLLGPEIAAGKRLNIRADAHFDESYSYLRIPPEALGDKVHGDRRRLEDLLRKLDEEIRPAVAAVVAAAQGEIDHATIAAPPDWRTNGAFAATPDESDTPSTHDPREPAFDPARKLRDFLTSRGLRPDAVAAVKVTTFVRRDEDWLRIDVPRGGTLRGDVPMHLSKAGVATMKNAKASHDDEILGTIYCKAADVRNLLADDPNSMVEYRPRR
ncbi:hypothetical protein [Paludisphaera mucosa]|uniref:Uncharacterized protein n=1 Tax=Paludisphaera mucosa TaxID=3030827 RepID=A0ABT6FBW8_9BACT|nr:hypothetical protein [Paludisphaera mucosa]MDG3005046.1 hypothetical protein [Paludisphaera mucosa]